MPDTENMEVENVDEEINQEGLEINDTTIEEQQEEPKMFSQEEVDNIVKERIGRIERQSRRKSAEKDRKLERYEQLEKTLRKGLELNEEDDVFEKIDSFYKEQGVDIPKYEPTSNKRDAERLGELDAQDLISSAEFDEIQSRANELASLKQKGKISNREEAEFMKLGNYLSNELKMKELKNRGVDEKILENKDFKEFSKKFNSDIPITDIYDLYSKINHKEAEKPASTGSVKSSVGASKVKTYYTSDEVDKLTSKDLDNPTIFKNVMASMKKWGK